MREAASRGFWMATTPATAIKRVMSMMAAEAPQLALNEAPHPHGTV